jgi:hypothetical protein
MERRDEWGHVGVKIFFREFIVHYFIHNTIIFVFSLSAKN